MGVVVTGCGPHPLARPWRAEGKRGARSRHAIPASWKKEESEGRREGQKEEVPILVPIVPFLPSLLRSFLDGREGVSRDRP